jgi:chaperone required for assembly of F1-ATPase
MAQNDDVPSAPKVPNKVLGREPPVLRKRFYKAATVVADGAGFGVQLDGRSVKTPRKLRFTLPNQVLAEAVATEWNAQIEVIVPALMQLTTIAFTAIDAVAEQKTEVAAEIARYAANDLLCYRAAAPEGLVARQVAGWDPILGWAEGALGVPFKRTTGLMHVSQDPEVATRVTTRLVTIGALELAATHVLTTLTGSAVLALAVRDRRLTIDEAWHLAHIDETWQIEKWGTDTEAQTRQATRFKTAQAAATVLLHG